MSKYNKILVIGGGAAGFFAAINIRKNFPDFEVTILEQSNEVLSKVSISGGGRCNVTHACWEPKELVKFYPRGSKELLGPFHHFACGDTFAWFEGEGIPLKIEDDGRYVNNPEIMGTCHFGNGCQILGNITVQNCVLAGGGSFKSKDPDLRGALLKGYGLARNLHLEPGQVINGRGHFSDDLIELQSAYH